MPLLYRASFAAARPVQQGGSQSGDIFYGASADYIQLYQGDSKTLAASLEWIQRTAAEMIEGVKPQIRSGSPAA